MSLHRLLKGYDDPAEPHRLKFLELLKIQGNQGWQDALECMISFVRQHRHEERKRSSRASAREKLQKVSDLCAELIKLADENEVFEALRTYAPAPTRGYDDVAGFEYLTGLAGRALQARGRITTGPGGHTLLADLGRPTAQLLCAMMVREAWKKRYGRAAGERNPHALGACEALWVAAGGAPTCTGDESDHWLAYLRNARASKTHSRQLSNAHNAAALRQPDDPELTKDRKAAAFMDARSKARYCLSHVQQERP